VPSHSPVRRRFTVVTTALVSLAAADFWVRGKSEALNPFYVDNYQRKTKALDQLVEAPRILILGSSRAAYALVPEEFERITGAAAFNLGIPASKVVEWQILVERTLARVRPDLVVLGVNAAELRADYLPVSAARDLFGFSDLIDYLAKDGWSFEVASHFLERRGGAAWPLFHRRFELLSWLHENAMTGAFPKHAQIARERRNVASRTCPPDGYEHPWLNNDRMRTLETQMRDDASLIVTAGTPEFDPDAPAMRRFGELLDGFGARSVPVIVAYLPNSPRTESRWSGGEGEIERAISQCCAERNIAYIGAGITELPRSNADYFEETHMGLQLAQRISRRAAECAVARGLIGLPETHFATSPEPVGKPSAGGVRVSLSAESDGDGDTQPP